MTAQPILLVGSVALDDIETPFGSVRDAYGGSATYFALAARFFAPLRLVAVVGTDFPAEHRALLHEAGVDTRGLEVAEGKCFRWGGKYDFDLNSRETLFTHLNVFEHFHPKVPAEYQDTPFVFLGNIHPELQSEVLEQVREPRLVALDTMNLWIETAREPLLRVLRSVDLLILNDGEARQLAGEPNLVRAGRRLLELGPRHVVIKKGEHGSMMFSESGPFVAAAVPLHEVLDPTGAGDSFAGGLMGYLAYAGDLSPRTIRTAMIMGSVMGSFAVEQFSVDGLRGLTPARIQERFDAMTELVHFERVALA